MGENRELDAPTLWDISAEDQSSHALLQTENAVYQWQVPGAFCRDTVAGDPVGHVPGGMGMRARECDPGTASSMVQWSPNPAAPLLPVPQTEARQAPGGRDSEMVLRRACSFARRDLRHPL